MPCYDIPCKKVWRKIWKNRDARKKKDSSSERNSIHKKGRSKATTKAREGQTSAAPITLLHFLRNYALALFDKFSPENTQWAPEIRCYLKQKLYTFVYISPSFQWLRYSKASRYTASSCMDLAGAHFQIGSKNIWAERIYVVKTLSSTVFLIILPSPY